MKEAQSEFLVLVEGAIRQPDLAKSVQRYQLAVDEAKVRLNLAVCPGARLMPGNMAINTERSQEQTLRPFVIVPLPVLGLFCGMNCRVKFGTVCNDF